ncbi:MAG: PEP-CTERM sorting domain-containing protein [Nitrospirae bacterium]|nr:MAG: PEP-CTERM sorting domain-containing protein [Nitrospirota bacterium]
MIALAILLAAPFAWAQANGAIHAGPIFELPGVATDVPFDPNSEGWHVGPQEVSYDPAAGPWLKRLAAPAYGPGNYGVIEELIVGPGPAWTDWHEEILSPSPGADWTGGTIYDASGAPVAGLTVQVMGPRIWFFFDPLPPGTPIQVVKTLHYGIAGANLPIDVAEYPTTPEPTSLALVAGCLAGLAVLRRRHG